jgi:hypothetical protein
VSQPGYRNVAGSLDFNQGGPVRAFEHLLAMDRMTALGVAVVITSIVAMVVVFLTL